MAATQTSPDPAGMAPVLRSIAREITERSLAIADLQVARRRHERAGEWGEWLGRFDARIAEHRRELRHAHEEFERLGWKRDDSRRRRFVYERPNPSGAAFFRALELGGSDEAA